MEYFPQRVCEGSETDSLRAATSFVVFLIGLFVESGNPKKHTAALKKAVDSGCVGEPSLYNALSIAMQTLKWVGNYCMTDYCMTLL